MLSDFTCVDVALKYASRTDFHLNPSRMKATFQLLRSEIREFYMILAVRYTVRNNDTATEKFLPEAQLVRSVAGTNKTTDRSRPRGLRPN